MTKIKNMGTSTMKFKEGIIVDGTAGYDTHAAIISGSLESTSTVYGLTGSFQVVDIDRLSLTSNQTVVPPLQLTANSLQDGVGALRIDGSQADIFLNPSTATHTTVTFAVNNDQRLAFGMDNNSDFYITRRTGGSWYDDTLVIDRDNGQVSLGYDLSVAGDIIVADEKTIGASDDSNFVKFSENSTTYSGTDLSIGSNQSVHVLLDMNADGATTGGFTVRTGGTTIDASDEVFKFGGDGKIAASKGAVVIEAIETSTYKTLQGTSANTAVLEDTTFTGLGTSSFTFSCWFYQNDTNSNPVSSNTKVRFLQSATERHVLNLGVPDVTIQYENASSGLDTADFDTNLTSGNWYHVVAHFDVGNLTTGAPRLWIDGQEIAAANYTAVGGTTPDIDRVTIYLDDGAAMQDAVFWDKLLSDSEISELWNNGYYMSPSLHSATGSIASYFLLGQEADLSSFNNGDTLTGEITLTDTAGSGNAFTLTLESEFSILSRTVQEISSPGFEVDSFSIGINRSFTPTSGSDTGKKGEIAWDENYIYVCVATDTWKRTALTSW